MFKDRNDAGRQLAHALGSYRGTGAVVLALLGGGAPLAAEISRTLGAPVNMIFVKKVVLPERSEIAMGAVVDGPVPQIVRNADMIHAFNIEPEDFDQAAQRTLDEIVRRKRRFDAVLPQPDIRGKIVILVDDGIVTGLTMRAAILAIQQYGVEKIVVAAPVAPAAVIADLEEEAEEVVCIAHLAPSRRMSDCYESFPRLSDDGIMDVLISANPQIAGKPLPAAVDQAS